MSSFCALNNSIMHSCIKNLLDFYVRICKEYSFIEQFFMSFNATVLIEYKKLIDECCTFCYRISKVLKHTMFPVL